LVRFAGVFVLLAVLTSLFVIPAAVPVVKPGNLVEAPDAVTAMAAARAQGSRVAMVSHRTDSREVYAEPNGLMTAEFSAVPVRVKQGNSWAPIDTNLVPQPDGTVRPRAAIGGLTLSGGGTAPLASLSRDGKRLSLSWPEPLPVPVLSGETATYRDVLPGVDLVMLAERDGFGQHLVIRNAEAARHPALTKISLRMQAEGLKVTVDDAGAIHAVDDQGKEVFAAPPSTMWDSSGPDATSSRSVPVRVTADQATLNVIPDQAFFADPATVFPVTVDPRVHVPSPNNWATVLSGHPTSSYPRTSGGGPDFAQTGNCPVDSGQCGPTNIKVARAYFQFDTSVLNSSHILFGATLTAHVANSPRCVASRHDIYMSYALIHDRLTWNNQPGSEYIGFSDVPPVHGCPNERSDAVFGIPLEKVNKGGQTVYYLRAQDEVNTDAWRRYHAASVRLSVTYNTPPNVPYQLGTDPPVKDPCRWCAGNSYIGDDFLQVNTRLSDNDGDRVQPEWSISRDGVAQARLGDLQTSGAFHSTAIDLRQLNGKRVEWSVRGWDTWEDGRRVNASDWRSGRPFVVDKTGVVTAPNVSGVLYPDDNRWHGGVGVPGVFTFDAAGVTDIDHYLYGWKDPPSTKVDAVSLGGGASVTIIPPGDGPRDLYVQSVDRAGHRSPAKVHHIYVRPGNGPLAQWAFEGNTKDDANLGFRDGTAQGNVGYAPGAVGSAVRLQGDGGHVTAPNTVRTDSSFSVSAWVKLDRTDAGRYTVVSQDGTNVYGLNLEYEGDTKKWTFVMTGTDSANVTAWYAIKSQIPPVANSWTHLTATYDSVSRQMTLYVNGVSSGSVRRETPWQANGLVRIGQLKAGQGFGQNWPGSIDEVKFYDRLLSDAEISSTVARDNVQVAHWKFEEEDGTTAKNDIAGGETVVLENGAHFDPAGAVNGAVQFDGSDDYAATDGPIIRTDQSFSVAGWIKVDRRAAANQAFTALSQDGGSLSGFSLGYREVDGGRWEFSMPSADSANPAEAVVRSTELAKFGEFIHLTAIYEAPTKQLRLYAGGQLMGTTTATGVFNATGKFVLGQGKRNGAPANALPGGVDEVRVYSRVISAEEIKGIVSRENVKALSWRFDGDAKDSAGQTVAHDGQVNGGANWSGGQTANPDPDDLAVNLDGVNDYVSTAKTPVNTSGSFSVSAWAKLSREPTGRATVVSQSADRSSMFTVGYTGKTDDRWAFTINSANTNAPDVVRVRSTQAAQVDTWTHLAAVYQASTGDMLLYVNGVLSASAKSTARWNADKSFDVGRAMSASTWTDYFPGAVDDIQVHSRALFAEEVGDIAGRDLALVHNWRMDESTGTNLSDAVGSRTATLNQGATFASGRVGNSIQLDGAAGAVTTAGVDLRTDESFTVSTWVKLTDTSCDPATPGFECKRVAFSVDGNNTSKFRLGHVVDQAHWPQGVWTFEMPESDSNDAVITKAAVAAIPADLNTWVHLLGVYDRQAKMITLYVDGMRRGDGTVNGVWSSGKGAAIGRGKVNTAAAQFWPGAVDDVRMYTGPLTGDRISDLVNSYPLERDSSVGMPTADAGHWTFDETEGDVVADSSGRGLTATIKDGGERLHGRSWNAGWFDGNGAHAETAGPAVDTNQNFTITAWAYLTDTVGGDRTVLSQDSAQESAFRMLYQAASDRWMIALPSGFQLVSTQPAVKHEWTHLAIAYNAPLRQLRLYVDGVLSVAQVGVDVSSSDGPLAMGRAKRSGVNSEFFASGIDDVRAFHKALTDTEVTSVHDDVPALDRGSWRFDEGTGKDYSWRTNDTTLSGSPTFVPGIIGKALNLNGTSGHATARIGVAPANVSFTVTAWARLSRNDKAYTVLSQDGDRMSGFALQYRPELNRWVFSSSTNDSDSSALVYTQSEQPAELNRWTHLAGVYDYNDRQLRIYVDGKLAGSRADATLWPSNGPFALGRGKYNGTNTEFFAGAVDEVHAFLGMASEDQIKILASHPEPWDGQLGRHATVTGDKYSASTSYPVPPGNHFETPLGLLVGGQQENTRTLYACKAGNDQFTSKDPGCETKTVLGEIGQVYITQPADVPTVPVYRCVAGAEHFDTLRTDCDGVSGAVREHVLGYTQAYSWLSRYYSDFDYDHFDSIHGGPAGYYRKDNPGLVSLVAQPGTQPLMSCVNGVDTFVSLDTACEGKTVVAGLGHIWSQPPADAESQVIYRCSINGESFVSMADGCEGFTFDRPLGYVLKPEAAPGFSRS
jgi:hypothetical protein